MKKNPVLCTIIISNTIFIVYLVFDYFNILELLNIDLNKIDTKTFEIVLNSLILITLFTITYFTIDSMNSKRMINQEKIADIILANAYQSCLDTIVLLENKEFKKIFLSKFDFDKNNDENISFQKLHDGPFRNEDDIIKLCKDGIIAPEKFKVYLRIKKEFHHYVSFSITFSGKEEEYVKNRDKVIKLINDELKNLNN